MHRWLALLLLAAFPAAAQPNSSTADPPGFEHGHQIASVFVYLSESPDMSFIDRATSGRGFSPFDLLRIMGPGGVQTLVVTPLSKLDENPGVGFETWGEQKFSQYMEDAICGSTGMERSPGRITVRRFMADELRQVYVSYAVTVEALPRDRYRVSFGPSADPPAAKGMNNPKIRRISPTKLPPPQIIGEDDFIRVELYSNGSSRRVEEYVRAGRRNRVVPRNDTPHDYYADDAQFTIAQPKVRVDGEDRPAAAPAGPVHGPMLWLYVPGRGRYLMSFHAQPEAGFESAGEVSGNSLAFTVAGGTFRIESAQRIADGSGDYTLHVRTEPNWQPADPAQRERVAVGVADRP